MESALIPYQASPGISARHVLVLAPHPDDEVFGCGGAIALHVLQQVPVDVVILTDGQGQGVANERAQESRAAAAVLGYGEPAFWGLIDREVRCSEALIRRLVEHIRDRNIDLVYAPSPWEIHPDHRQTELLAREAVRRCTHPVRLAHYEVGSPLRPNVLVNITPVLEFKQQAMQCFASQLVQQDYAQHIDALNRYRTYTLPGSIKAAEAFCLLTVTDLEREAAQGPMLGVSPGLLAEPYASAPDLPLVSILMRSLDRPYLAQALDSVAIQTYPSIEILVQAVKPGHQPLPPRCGPYSVRLLDTDHPLPRSEAANRLLGEARGQWLLFLDDDDWLMPSHIGRLVQAVAGQTAALAAYTGVAQVDAQNRPLGAVFDIPFDPTRLLAGNLMPIHAVLFSAQLVQQGCRFDTAFTHYEDWDFWLQVSRHTTLMHLPGVSAAYRIHDSSGVHQSAGPLAESSAVIYQKWQSEWTPAQRGALMQRVWAYADLEQRLINAQHGPLDNQHVRLDTEHAQIDAVHALLDAQQALTDAIAQHQLQQQQQLLLQQTIDHQTRQITELDQALATRLSDVTALQASLSWRLTAPLRQLSDALNFHQRRLTWVQRWRSTWLQMLRVTANSGLTKSLLQLFAPSKLRHTAGLWRQRWRRGLQLMTTEGWRGVWYRTLQASQSFRCAAPSYVQWIEQFGTPNQADLDAQQKHAARWLHPPLISVVMPVYNPPIDLLQQAVRSIQAQTWSHWELCIADDASPNHDVWASLQALAADDPRIHLVRRPVNGHISEASNSALELAHGEFIALMDNDDLLPPDALYWVADAIQRFPAAQIIYTDEDKLGQDGERFGPYMKSAWNHALFLGHNMISHLGVYRRALVQQVGGFRKGYEGSQDYDLALRCLHRVSPEQIIHIPRVLYHWRVLPGSTALAMNEKPYALTSACKALDEYLGSYWPGASTEVTPAWNYLCRPPAVDLASRLSVVMVAKDPLKSQTLTSGFSVSGHCLERVWSEASSSALNRAIQTTTGEFVALLHADLTPLSDDALEQLCAQATRQGVVAVAGALYSHNDLLINGGLMLNPITIAKPVHHGLPLNHPGYMGRAQLVQELSAVAMDCVVIRRQAFIDSGGFNFPQTPSETGGVDMVTAVDWCLRMRKLGHRVVWAPQSRWRYPRSHDDALAAATLPPPAMMQQLHHLYRAWLENDPAYHPSLNRVLVNFSLSAQPTSQAARTSGH